MACRGGGWGSPRMEILSPPRSLRDALANLPPISTLPCSSSNCTRERLTSFNCWARKRSRRCPLASWGTVSWRSFGSCNRSSCSSSTIGGAMGDLSRWGAMQPQEAPGEHHRRGNELGDRDQSGNPRAAIAAQESKYEVGEATQEEPRAEDLSIVMGAIEQPQQEGEQHELHQAGIDLGG